MAVNSSPAASRAAITATGSSSAIAPGLARASTRPGGSGDRAGGAVPITADSNSVVTQMEATGSSFRSRPVTFRRTPSGQPSGHAAGGLHRGSSGPGPPGPENGPTHHGDRLQGHSCGQPAGQHQYSAAPGPPAYARFHDRLPLVRGTP